MNPTPAALLVSLSALFAANAASGLQKINNYWIGPLSNPLFGKSPADPARPDILIHVPPGYRATAAVDLVIYFHGMRNCILNAAANKGCATKGYDPGQSLIDQFDRSGLNAVLILLQGVYNQGVNDSRLAKAPGGFFRDFVINELSPLIRQATGKGAAGLGKVWLAGHSGAYVPLQKILKDGGLDAQVAGIVLLDSLYGAGGWPDALAAWKAARADGRMVAICNDTKSYIDPVANALKKKKLQTWKGAADNPPATLRAEPFQFFATSVPHPTIPGKFFGPLLSALQKPAAAAAKAPDKAKAGKPAPKKKPPKSSH